MKPVSHNSHSPVERSITRAGLHTDEVRSSTRSPQAGMANVAARVVAQGAQPATPPIGILITEPMGADANRALNRLDASVATVTEVPNIKGISPQAMTKAVAGFIKEHAQKTGQSFDLLVVRGNVQAGPDLLGEVGDAYLPAAVIRAGTGMDNIDTAYLDSRGVSYENTPSVNTQATAEMAVGLMFAATRNIGQADAMVKQGVMDRGALMGTELSGKTLGIVGMGRIGATVAKVADAIGMKVIGLKPRSLPDGAQAPAQVNGGYVKDIDSVFEQSDVVSLHVPLTPATKSLVNAERLTRLNGYLINTARGGVVDEQALLNALNSGAMKGAGLDVLQEDPAPAGSLSDQLAKHPRVVVTPHTGGQTHEASYKMGQAVADKAKAMFLQRAEANRHSVH